MNFKNVLDGVTNWVRPDLPSDTVANLDLASALSERNKFMDLLPYREVSEDNMVFLDTPDEPAMAFMFHLSPMLGVGGQTEDALESLIGNSPSGSVLQFYVVSTPQVGRILDIWEEGRNISNKNPVLSQMVDQRVKFFKFCSEGPSLLPSQKMHPRNLNYYFSARVPFTGDMKDIKEFEAYVKRLQELRESLKGVFKGAGIEASVMDEAEIKFMLREVLNPHISPERRLAESVDQVPMHKDLMARNTRVSILEKGLIGFSENEGDPEVICIPITCDAYPNPLSIGSMAMTLGNPLSWDDRITVPFVSYTNIQVLDTETSKDKLLTKQGVLAKQTMSDSAWYRSLMGHIFERKQAVDALVSETRSGRRLVRAYSGINIYCNPVTWHVDLEQTKSIWRRAGFRVSEERFITLPAFLASLPMNYSHTFDPPNKGLMRAALMSSTNASSLAQVQGDWYGTGADKGGPLLVSRRGQIAAIDLFTSNTNYNAVVIAQSGSGKSVFTSELICDMLSRNGRVRMIDVGRSYFRLADVLGGQNLVFQPENPKSLNPLWGITNESDLAEMMPMLKALIRQMAYPLTPEEQTPAWEYAAIEAAVKAAWELKKGTSGLSDVYFWMLQHKDPRANDLAMQIEPFAVGRYSAWFNGRRDLDFNNDLVVIELEELKIDPELSAVVLALLIHHTTREMYLSDRSRKYMLGIDEAWDLLSGLKTGAYIESAFRRLRKYNGCAVVISQGFMDFEKSAAGRAAVENANWQFLLSQKSESIDTAVQHSRISNDQGVVSALKSVRSGPGFSEILIRNASDGVSGLYRFIMDRHSYYTYTTKATETTEIDKLVSSRGISIAQAIDIMAKRDYKKMFGIETLDEEFNNE